MKKISALLLSFVMVLILCACGGDDSSKNKNSGPDFSEKIRSIDFSMTKDDIKNLENGRCTEEDNDFLAFRGDLDGYPGEIFYKFYEESGTLSFVKFKFDNEDDYYNYMSIFKTYYGEPNKSGSANDEFKFWNGTVNGVKAYFAAGYPTGGYLRSASVSVARVNAPSADEYKNKKNSSEASSSSTPYVDYIGKMSESEIEAAVEEAAISHVLLELSSNKKYDLSKSTYKMGTIAKLENFDDRYEAYGTIYLYNMYGSLEDVATFYCNSIWLLNDEDNPACSMGSCKITY